MKKSLLIITGLIWFNSLFAQFLKDTKVPNRGFTFKFSNAVYKNFPQVIQVYPLSDADRAGLRYGMVIAKVNDTYFAKMSEEKITEFLLNLSNQPLVLGMMNTDNTNSNDISANYTIKLPAFIPPVQSSHPDGECLSGDCMDGEGYIKFTNRDLFRGSFAAGKPVKGEYFVAANGSRKQIPEIIDTTYKEYLYDLTTLNGVGDQKFKRLYIPKLATAEVYYASGRIYNGERNGLVPHGKGEVRYTVNRIIDPFPSQSIEGKMILEGEFENGKFVKATRLRSDANTGMFIDGNISAGIRNHNYFWMAQNPILKSWSWRNSQNNLVDEVRTVFESKPGGICIDGKFDGPGTWYCNQYAYSPLYGAEIHVLKMKSGFVQDSVELVIPHLNYRKKFSVVNYPRMFLRLDMLEQYIEIYYTTGQLPTGNWNTFTGGYVTPPTAAAPKTYTHTDLLRKVAAELKTITKTEGIKSMVTAEGAVMSDAYLTTGYTVGEYLDYGESLALLVFTLKDEAVEVTGPNGKCAPVVVSGNASTLQVQLYNCTGTQEQNYKKFFSFNIAFYKSNTESYYVLYKFSGQ